MFLFLRFLLAHVVTDFPLQIDEVYRLKKSGWFGVILHAAVVTAGFAAAAFPYWGNPAVWAFVLFIGVTHAVEDHVKLRLNVRYPNHFLIFTGDQVLHVLFILTIFLTPLADYEAPAALPGILSAFYRSDFLVLLAIGYTLAGFASPYFLNTFTTTFFKGKRGDLFVTKWEMIHGIVERTALLTLLLLNGGWLWGIPAVFLGRMPFKELRSGFQILLSGGVSVLIFAGIRWAQSFH